MTRSCARPGCGDTATSTLTYDYHGQAVWLDSLAFEAHPAAHDLCTRHADRLSPPRGWRFEDRRDPVVEPLWRQRAS